MAKFFNGLDQRATWVAEQKPDGTYCERQLVFNMINDGRMAKDGWVLHAHEKEDPWEEEMLEQVTEWRTEDAPRPRCYCRSKRGRQMTHVMQRRFLDIRTGAWVTRGWQNPLCVNGYFYLKIIGAICPNCGHIDWHDKPFGLVIEEPI